MAETHVVILAAGQGTRMKSSLPKVLHPVAGRPMVEQVVQTASSLSPASITVVVGHQAEAIQTLLGGRQGVHFALQAPQLGTAHALQQAEPLLAGRTGTLVLLSGDVPLLKAATLGRLLGAVGRHHQKGQSEQRENLVAPGRRRGQNEGQAGRPLTGSWTSTRTRSRIRSTSWEQVARNICERISAALKNPAQYQPRCLRMAENREAPPRDSK